MQKDSSRGKSNPYIGSNPKPVVKVVAIAKDEAAYISDWISHHLYFGFDKVHVYTNRINDDTESILYNIASKRREVSYENFDWVDLIGSQKVSGKMQQLAYAHALSFSRAEKDCDYLLFIDIDEFWTPKDFSSGIADCLEGLNLPDAISFEWENLRADNELFGAIPRRLVVKGGVHVKTAIKIDSNVNRIRVHAPALPASSRHLLPDGSNFRYQQKNSPQKLNRPSQQLSKDFFILHRLFRSELEYVAALIRGVPNRDGIKINRPGFLKPNNSCEVVDLDASSYSEYIRFVEDFREELNLNDAINIAQKHLIEKVDDFISVLPVVALKNFNDVNKVLRGVKDQRVSTVIDRAQNVVDNLEPLGDLAVPKLIELAFSFEKKNDYYSAYYLMLKASEIRPNGPVIKDSIHRYESKLS